MHRKHPSTVGRLPPGSFGFSRGRVHRNYALIVPEGPVDSFLPTYEKTAVAFLASPAMGARFAQALLKIDAGGGTVAPISDGLQHFFYVLSGTIQLAIDNAPLRTLSKDNYAYIPSNSRFSLQNQENQQAKLLELKKPYHAIDLPPPEPVVSNRNDRDINIDPDNISLSWQHLLPPGDFRFDMEMNILSFDPGTYFHAVETHIMEHGLYMLNGQGLYLLDTDWHEVWEGDFIWMGPYCPQLFHASGSEKSAYLLYKDVNRDVIF